MATAESLAMVQEFYIGYYGRPADPSGLTYWADRFDASDNLDDVLAAFGESAEFTDNFGSLTNEQLVNNLYDQMFGRVAEAEGLAFYTDLLTTGAATLASIAKQIVDGASGDDVTVLANRVIVAQTYTDAVTSMSSTYESDDIADAQAILDAVDVTDASVTAGNTAAEAEVASNVEGGTFTLTADPDTATASIFEAHRVWNPDGSDQMNSLNDDDVLTGVGDNPTLNFTFITDTETFDFNIMPEMTGMETINTKFTSDVNQTLDLQDTTGLLNLNATRIDDIPVTPLGVQPVVTFDNIQSALTTASVSNSNDNTTVDMIFDHSASALSGSKDAVVLSLSDVQMDILRIDGVTQGYETINLSSSGEANSLNILQAEELETLNVTGDQNLNLGATANVENAAGLVEATHYTAGFASVAGSFSTLDATAFTGVLDVTMGNELNAGADGTSGTSVDFSLIGGEGNDMIRLAAGANLDLADTIDGGAGATEINTLVTHGTSTFAGTVSNVQALEVRTGHDGGLVADAVVIDTALFTELDTTLIRNEGHSLVGGTWTSGAEGLTTTLNNMTDAQANALTYLHGTTGNNGLANNILTVDFATNAATNVVGVTLADAPNIDLRFNFMLTSPEANSLLFTDNDTESNSVDVTSFNTVNTLVTVTGGEAGDFFNLDAESSVVLAVGALPLTGRAIDMTGGTIDTYALNAGRANSAAQMFNDVGASALANRFGTATINAVDYLGDLIVRVDSNAADTNGAQTITCGLGDDFVIFDDITATSITVGTAGLTNADIVAGGEGNDTLGIDGNGRDIIIQQSEWDNVSGFETIQLMGNGAGFQYYLQLDNDLIDANGGTTGNMLNITNDDGSNVGIVAGGTVATDSTDDVISNTAVRIDGTNLSAANHFTYDGEEGTGSTVDRFVVNDANANGGNIIYGGEVSIHDNATTFVRAVDVLEIRNTSTITTSDLSNIYDVGNIVFNNDQAVVQTLNLTLNDTVIDAMADSGHTATVLVGETLIINADDGLMTDAAGAVIVPFAGSALNINARSLDSGLTGLIISDDDTNDTADTISITARVAGQAHNITFDNTVANNDTVNVFGAATTAIYVSGAVGTLTYITGAATLTDNIVEADIMDFSNFTGIVAITGDAGAETLIGGAGADIIIGGAGADTLIGGTGADVFVFATGDTGITLATADTIVDFSTAAVQGDTIATSFGAGNATIADGTLFAPAADLGEAAFIAAATAVFTAANTPNNDDVYVAWNAAATGNAYVMIDENDNGVVDVGDTMLILTGINTAAEIVVADFV